jgi:hypothetical protein
METESEFGDFEDGLCSQSHTYSNGQRHEQVLMVHDTGATPTMSPNPNCQQQHSSKEDNQAQNLDFHHHFWGGGEKDPEFDWDDGWEDAPGKAQAGEPLSSGVLDANVTASGGASGSKTTGVYVGPKSPLAPMSAIPGLASIASGAAPSALQMSSWVGTVGKRWGEIKESTT